MREIVFYVLVATTALIFGIASQPRGFAVVALFAAFAALAAVIWLGT